MKVGTDPARRVGALDPHIDRIRPREVLEREHTIHQSGSGVCGTRIGRHLPPDHPLCRRCLHQGLLGLGGGRSGSRRDALGGNHRGRLLVTRRFRIRDVDLCWLRGYRGSISSSTRSEYSSRERSEQRHETDPGEYAGCSPSLEVKRAGRKHREMSLSLGTAIRSRRCIGNHGVSGTLCR